jgi:hypothetical protein
LDDNGPSYDINEDNVPRRQPENVEIGRLNDLLLEKDREITLLRQQLEEAKQANNNAAAVDQPNVIEREEPTNKRKRKRVDAGDEETVRVCRVCEKEQAIEEYIRSGDKRKICYTCFKQSNAARNRAKKENVNNQ